MGPDEIARIRELHASDELAHAMGVSLAALSEQSLTLEMTVRADHVGYHGRCHGGVLFTLADIAMSYIGNRFPDMAYATHAAIDFIGGVDLGDTVTAVANESVRSGRSAIFDVTLTVGDEGIGVFRGNTLSTRSKNPS
jgi:acyl-CoA thioesterase